MASANMTKTIVHPGGWDHDQDIVFFEYEIISNLAYQLISLGGHRRFFYKDSGNLALQQAAEWVHMELPDQPGFELLCKDLNSVMWKSTGRTLHAIIDTMIVACPEIVRFNESIWDIEKPLEHYDEIPDHQDTLADWIDLDALSRNIMNSMIYKAQLSG